jgi:DNA polymerase III subunit delta'
VSSEDRSESGAAPDFRAMLGRAQAPWLAPLRERLASSQDQNRLAHGLLFAGAPGSGQAELGAWMAARLLCLDRARRPCGACVDCRLYLAGNHPDVSWVTVAEDKKAIAIEQVRELSEALSLKSYRGGAKIALIVPAEAMNAHSFNALLKTLEEPAGDTYVALATSRLDRIPRTIASRCARFAVPVPAAADATEWLSAGEARKDWATLLELAGGAPFLAEAYAREDLGDLGDEMRELIDAAVRGRLDLPAMAKACAERAPAARLAWLEMWLTRSLKEAALASDLVNNNRLPWLQPPGTETKIRAGYRLLDELRDARRQLGGPLNTQLLFEGLLVSLAAWIGGPAARAGGKTG